MFFVRTFFIVTITARPIISYITTVVVRWPWAVATTKKYQKNDFPGPSAAAFSTLAAKRLNEIECSLFCPNIDFNYDKNVSYIWLRPTAVGRLNCDRKCTIERIDQLCHEKVVIFQEPTKISQKFKLMCLALVIELIWYFLIFLYKKLSHSVFFKSI